MTPKEQAIELLCKGVTTTQVADAIGVDPSYVSQLKADPEVAEKIAAATAGLTIADIEFDSRLERAEELALEQIERKIQYANFGQSLAAFRILNSATRRKAQTANNAGAAGNVTVNIVLPTGAIPKYTINAKSEIVEVEGQTMLSMQAKSLDQILAARAAGNTKGIPQVTDLEKAATTLENLTVPVRRPAPKLPKGLSVDIL